MSVIRVAKGAGLSLVCAVLFGCGFSLRGQATLPPEMESTYIEWPASPHYELKLRLEQALHNAGVVVMTDPEIATATLRITKAEVGERVLSVSAMNRPAEYLVFVRVTFDLHSDGRVLFPEETQTLVEDYSFDPTAVLSKMREGKIIELALIDDMVAQILRRLEAAGQITPGPATSETGAALLQ